MGLRQDGHESEREQRKDHSLHHRDQYFESEKRDGHDKYAKRIERMPILGVDEDVLNYGAFVANTLRQASGSVKTMGIQSNLRESQITGGDVYGGDYGYGDYRYGAYGPYGRRAQMGRSRPSAPNGGLSAPRRRPSWPPMSKSCVKISSPPRPTSAAG